MCIRDSFYLNRKCSGCGNNVVAFFLDLWEQRPRHVRLRAVRADSGFCVPELLQLWEQLQLPYIVVARLMAPIQSLIRNNMVWTATELVGTDVAELEYHARGWPYPRRLILIRHRQADRPEAGGKKLFEMPGYLYQALVTSLPTPVPPLAVWRDYNGRADCENVIKELQQGFALPTLCLRSFWATEAALSLATLTYNLTVLFQRALGWQTKVTIHSLRFWLFITPGIIAHPAGKTTIKLAVPQLQFSRKSARICWLNMTPTAWFRLIYSSKPRMGLSFFTGSPFVDQSPLVSTSLFQIPHRKPIGGNSLLRSYHYLDVSTIPPPAIKVRRRRMLCDDVVIIINLQEMCIRDRGEVQRQGGRIGREKGGLRAQAKAAGEQGVQPHEKKRHGHADAPESHHANGSQAAQSEETVGLGGACRQPREQSRSTASLTSNIARIK